MNTPKVRKVTAYQRQILEWLAGGKVIVWDVVCGAAYWQGRTKVRYTTYETMRRYTLIRETPNDNWGRRTYVISDIGRQALASGTYSA